jgi:hypothetical protein
MDQFYMPLYSNKMKRDRFLHILRFLHFSDNRNEIDKTEENCDRLWKIHDMLEILKEAFSKLYNHSKHLAVDEVTVLFKRRVVFKHYIPIM